MNNISFQADGFRQKRSQQPNLFRTRNTIPLHPPSPNHKRLSNRQQAESVSIFFPEGLHLSLIHILLLLNATLTVRAHQAGSHQRRGWEEFTDAAIRILAEQRENIVFILWGSYAQKKGAFIDRNKHLVLASAHPSPLSAYNGFFGNKQMCIRDSSITSHHDLIQHFCIFF